MTMIIEFCPMCPEKPTRPKYQDPLNPIAFRPRICLSCQATNGQMTAQIKAAGKVRVIPPGVSALDKKEHQNSLHNPHREKKLKKKNRSRKRPP